MRIHIVYEWKEVIYDYLSFPTKARMNKWLKNMGYPIVIKKVYEK